MDNESSGGYNSDDEDKAGLKGGHRASANSSADGTDEKDTAGAEEEGESCGENTRDGSNSGGQKSSGRKKKKLWRKKKVGLHYYAREEYLIFQHKKKLTQEFEWVLM